MRKRTILTMIMTVSITSSMLACKTNEEAGEASLKSSFEEITEMTSLDDIYAHVAIGDHPDIRDLPEDYSKDQAKYEDCFVIGAMVCNDDLYYTFMDDYNKGISSFIRVVQNTAEGDAIITDVLYDENTDLVYVVTDHTRDAYASEKDRIIQYNTYEKIGTWKPEHTYWVAYNGELPAEYKECDDIIVITIIN